MKVLTRSDEQKAHVATTAVSSAENISCQLIPVFRSSPRSQISVSASWLAHFHVLNFARCPLDSFPRGKAPIMLVSGLRHATADRFSSATGASRDTGAAVSSPCAIFRSARSSLRRAASLQPKRPKLGPAQRTLGATERRLNGAPIQITQRRR